MFTATLGSLEDVIHYCLTWRLQEKMFCTYSTIIYSLIIGREFGHDGGSIQTKIIGLDGRILITFGIGDVAFLPIRK